MDNVGKDAQVAYTPILDSSRDKQLLTVLPDYLTDEIVFDRPQAAMFYSRLLTFVNKK